MPTEKLVELAPGFGYQLYLSNNATGGAVEMDADPRNAIRSCAQVASSKVPEAFLKDQTSFLGAWRAANQQANRTDIPASGIMSKKVEDYMVASYQKQGFYNSMSLLLSHRLSRLRCERGMTRAPDLLTSSANSLQRIPTPQPLRYLAFRACSG